jgi:adenosine deaminase
MFCSPSSFAPQGLHTQKLIEAIRLGLSRVPDIEIALVVDLVRNYGPERAMVTLAAVNEVRDLGVIGIGIGGSEHTFPPEPFEEVYATAQQFGLHTTAYAGEAAGAASIWGAIRRLRVDRIGHGTRAEEDPRLLHYLAETGLPLEMCPMSNVRTGVVQSLEASPVRRCVDQGMIVTINTDDPTMFGTSLAEEYRLLEEKLGFSRDEIRTLILQGIHASWLPEDRKHPFVEAFQKDAAW